MAVRSQQDNGIEGPGSGQAGQYRSCEAMTAASVTTKCGITCCFCPEDWRSLCRRTFNQIYCEGRVCEPLSRNRKTITPENRKCHNIGCLYSISGFLMALTARLKRKLPPGIRRFRNRSPTFSPCAAAADDCGRRQNAGRRKGRHLAIEAPTGVGKTLSYLSPVSPLPAKSKKRWW